MTSPTEPSESEHYGNPSIAMTLLSVAPVGIPVTGLLGGPAVLLMILLKRYISFGGTLYTMVNIDFFPKKRSTMILVKLLFYVNIAFLLGLVWLYIRR